MLRHTGGKSMFFFNTISLVGSLLIRRKSAVGSLLARCWFRPITADSVRPNKAPPYLIERDEAVAQG